MTQETTVARISKLISSKLTWKAAEIIADEIDGLRAEIARLKPAAEAWEAEERYRRAERRKDEGRLAYVFPFSAEHIAARDACDTARNEFNAAAARARAAKERKP